jgi:hypothetical protein
LVAESISSASYCGQGRSAVTIADFVGADNFARYTDEAKRSQFAGQLIGDMTSDELLALVGWLGDERKRQRASFDDIMKQL